MITRLKLSTIEQGLPKYRSMLAGNPAYQPTAFDSIATVNPTSGTSVTFSNIPGTYQHLQIRYLCLTDAYSSITLQVNSDTGNNYAWHNLWGRGLTTSSVGAEGTATTNNVTVISNNIEGTTDVYPNVGIIDIHDYASTSKNKTIKALAGGDNNGAANPREMIQLSSGVWLSTSAITSIKITTGTLASGTTFALYGIAGA